MTARGFALWLDRETWGVVTDALIEHRVSSRARKVANVESTSDIRADLCADAIRQINDASADLDGPRLTAIPTLPVRALTPHRRRRWFGRRCQVCGLPVHRVRGGLAWVDSTGGLWLHCQTAQTTAAVEAWDL